MSMPLKLEAAFSVLNHCRCIEVGPVPNTPAPEWKPEYGRHLTKAEERLKDHAIGVIELFFQSPGFGPIPQEPPNPLAAMFQMVAAQEKPPEPPSAEPPGTTVPAPEPPPNGSGDVAGQPTQPEEKKPESTPVRTT